MHKRREDIVFPLYCTLRDLYSGRDVELDVTRTAMHPKQCNVLLKENVVLRMRVEPGMADGQTITLCGEGHLLPGRARGDLIAVIHQEKSEFTRVGDDLVLRHRPASHFMFKHLDGTHVCVSVLGNVKPGDVKQVECEGMPVLHSSRRGRLFIVFEARS